MRDRQLSLVSEANSRGDKEATTTSARRNIWSCSSRPPAEASQSNHTHSLALTTPRPRPAALLASLSSCTTQGRASLGELVRLDAGNCLDENRLT